MTVKNAGDDNARNDTDEDALGYSLGLELSKSHREVIVHPSVFLSVVDHYARIAQGTNRRVVGTLLGEVIDGQLHATTSFAVPFEENPKDQSVWYIDHNYHETFFSMFRKINRKEVVIGWYSTGPTVRTVDSEIHELFRRYCHDPVYLIVDVNNNDDTELPTKAYYSVDVPNSDRTFRRTFIHAPSSTGAFEIEEIGVEHLLRDMKNTSTSTLTSEIMEKLSAMESLISKLRLLAGYLRDVADEKIQPNPKILYNMQNVFSLLPDTSDDQLIKAIGIQTNDTLLSFYLGSVTRSILAIHDLINNKLENKRKRQAAIDEAAKPQTSTPTPAITTNDENKNP